MTNFLTPVYRHVFIFLSLYFLFFWQVSHAADANDAKHMVVANVVWVDGNLSAASPNEEARPLKKNSVIYLHDTLTTDAKSQAQIVFTDNTLMTFRQSTTFYISQYSYDPKNKKSVGKFVTTLIEGGFRTITGYIAKKNPDQYQVNTPVATIGVRGTDYAVYVHQGQAKMAYYRGEPCIHNDKGAVCLNHKTRYSQVNANEAPIIIPKQPDVFDQPLKIVPARYLGPGKVGYGSSSDINNDTVSSFCIVH